MYNILNINELRTKAFPPKCHLVDEENDDEFYFSCLSAWKLVNVKVTGRPFSGSVWWLGSFPKACLDMHGYPRLRCPHLISDQL